MRIEREWECGSYLLLLTIRWKRNQRANRVQNKPPSVICRLFKVGSHQVYRYRSLWEMRFFWIRRIPRIVKFNFEINFILSKIMTLLNTKNKRKNLHFIRKTYWYNFKSSDLAVAQHIERCFSAHICHVLLCFAGFIVAVTSQLPLTMSCRGVVCHK